MLKIKKDKVLKVYQNQTLDEKLRDKMYEFQNNRDSIESKKEQLFKYNTELMLLHGLISYTDEQIKRRAELKTIMKNLEKEIYDAENDVSELDYYFKVDDFVMDYYDLSVNDLHLYSEHPELMEEKKQDIPIQEATDLKQFNKISVKKVNKPVKKRKKVVQTNSNQSILFLMGAKVNNEPIPEDKTICKHKNKALILDQYMQLTDGDYMCDKKKGGNGIKICDQCNIEKTINHSDGTLVCKQCGEAEIIIIDSEKPNYKENVTDNKTAYPYKRQNHLSEWLSQFQAKESVDIPDDVYLNIVNELKKNRKKQLKITGIAEMKKILKKLNYTQYYEHTIYIISRITKTPAPTISRETEDIIRFMFKLIQEPFNRHCPKGRKNFLSYSYVLHKFFQLIGLDELVDYFPLLKSREKLMNQDKIWIKICDDLGWTYYPSV